MTWSSYAAFLAFAAVLVLVPGPDFAVVTKNTLAGGRRRGAWTAAGVTSSNAVQGCAAAAGLGALVVQAQPVFEAIKWVGAGYLALLGLQALRSAVAGEYPPLGAAGVGTGGWRQGFLSNVSNPKVLVFYLAVLPQFLGPGASLGWLVLFALSHALLSLGYLLLLVGALDRLRTVLFRRRVRRTLDALTGTALCAFSARLALERG